jgi:hypothetical protein
MNKGFLLLRYGNVKTGPRFWSSILAEPLVWLGTNKGFLLLRKCKNRSQVLVIYTFGNNGMVRNEQGVLAPQVR